MVRIILVLVPLVIVLLQSTKTCLGETHIYKIHSKEDWSKSNIASPAWMSRYILWGKPTLKGTVDNANKQYKGVKFILK